MAQQPATPKRRRLTLRLLAAISPGLALRLPMAASERAALALRAALPSGPLAAAQEVRLLIPLVGQDDVTDWQAVTDRLRTTLQSLIDQDDPRWTAVICCQTRPPLPDDPRITHLPFDDPTPGNDKWRKLAALCDHLPDMSDAPGYVMSFDADDLMRQGTIAEMLAAKAPGWLVQSGLVMDHATRAIALADAPSLATPSRKPFWKLCGSCAAVWHDPAIPEATAFLKAMTAHEHRMFPHLAALAGLPLRPLSRPSVLYVLNHGENFGARRGRVGYKTRFVRRFQITDAQVLDAISRDFPPL